MLSVHCVHGMFFFQYSIEHEHILLKFVSPSRIIHKIFSKNMWDWAKIVIQSANVSSRHGDVCPTGDFPFTWGDRWPGTYPVVKHSIGWEIMGKSMGKSMGKTWIFQQAMFETIRNHGCLGFTPRGGHMDFWWLDCLRFLLYSWISFLAGELLCWSNWNSCGLNADCCLGKSNKVRWWNSNGHAICYV